MIELEDDDGDDEEEVWDENYEVERGQEGDVGSVEIGDGGAEAAQLVEGFSFPGYELQHPQQENELESFLQHNEQAHLQQAEHDQDLFSFSLLPLAPLPLPAAACQPQQQLQQQQQQQQQLGPDESYPPLESHFESLYDDFLHPSYPFEGSCDREHRRDLDSLSVGGLDLALCVSGQKCIMNNTLDNSSS